MPDLSSDNLYESDHRLVIFRIHLPLPGPAYLTCIRLRPDVTVAPKGGDHAADDFLLSRS